MKMMKGLEHKSNKELLRELVLSTLEKRALKREINTLCNNLKGGHSQVGVALRSTQP